MFFFFVFPWLNGYLMETSYLHTRRNNYNAFMLVWNGWARRFFICRIALYYCTKLLLRWLKRVFYKLFRRHRCWNCRKFHFLYRFYFEPMYYLLFLFSRFSKSRSTLSNLLRPNLLYRFDYSSPLQLQSQKLQNKLSQNHSQLLKSLTMV